MLLIDADAQGNLTDALGWYTPDELYTTIATIMQSLIDHNEVDPNGAILHHAEGVDLVPANIALSALDVSIINALSRETILKRYERLLLLKNERSMMEERYQKLFTRYGDVLTVSQLAEYLDVSSNTVYSLLKRKRIRGRRVGGQWRIIRKNVIDYLE